VKDGLFRQDLYYRLAVVPISVAPLRKRRDDIPTLCELFRHQISRELKMPVRPINAAAIDKLKRYDFPGNIRELRNLIERALILSAKAELGPADFPLAANEGALFDGEGGTGQWIASMPESVNLRGLLEEAERLFIMRALKSSGGVQAEAARRLRLSRSDLAYKLNKHEISSNSAGTSR
jgi:DNA-binding NtrC family response regulator